MISSCAPRIWRRLAGWKALKSQVRAPMPPPATLALSGTDPASWPASNHYRRLLQAIENLLEQQSATGNWRFLPYESLPVCSGAAEARRPVQPVVKPLSSGA